MKVTNHTKQVLLAERARIADTFFRRLRGLLGTKQLPLGEGLIIKPCSSIHTIGMAYHIDVLFLNKDDLIVKIAAGLEPRRMVSCKGSYYVIELPAGTVAQTKTVVGDRICISAD